MATITTAAATNTAAAAVAQTLNKSQSRIAKFLPAIKLSKVNHLRSARVFRYISIFIFVPISNLVGLFVQFCLQLIYMLSGIEGFFMPRFRCANKWYVFGVCAANFDNTIPTLNASNAVMLCGITANVVDIGFWSVSNIGFSPSSIVRSGVTLVLVSLSRNSIRFAIAFLHKMISRNKWR